MAMASGTATGYLDLYNKIRAFILDDIDGAGWLPLFSGAKYGDGVGIRNLRSSPGSAWQVFDNTTTTYARFPYNTGFISFQLFESNTIESIKLTSPSQTGGGLNTYSAKDVNFYTSTDGAIWILQKSWTNLAQWTDKETRELTLDSPVTTQWVKITFPVCYNSNADIAQLQLFDDSATRIHVNFGSSVGGQVCVKSPFTASGVSAHVRMFLYSTPDSNYVMIGFHGASDIQSANDAYTGLDYPLFLTPSGAEYIYLWDSPMPYWLYGNERYVYGFVKVGSTYRQFGFGYLLPYATPQQYVLPMFVGAENNGATIWDNDDNNNIRGFTNPAGQSLQVFTPTNTWAAPRNHYEQNGDYFGPAEDRIWPMCTAQGRALTNSIGTDSVNGNYALLPIIAFNYNDTIYGELPNIYAVPNLALTSEDTITIGGDTYLVFQNIWRTSRWDYCAVKEE